ncbi:hypothetical protein GGS21DRAFT_544306 [Xylaria nigripes]|nr:hypothetical protein GGS21DRAFT_544306 [Xylaria nigripes]
MASTESVTMSGRVPDSQRNGTQRHMNDDSQESNIPNSFIDEDGHHHRHPPDLSLGYLRDSLTNLFSSFGRKFVLEQTEEIIGGKKRKRNYISKSENYTELIHKRLKEFELSCRVAFFLKMNNSQGQYLFDYFMSEYEGPIELRSWLADVARDRMNSNFNSWKFRIIDNLINHVRVLNKEETEFRRAKMKLVAATFAEKTFNLESFVMIFDFVKGFIDLRDPLPIVKKYCKLLYVELVSYAKMHTNWLDDPKRLDASEYTRKGLANRVVTCAGSTKWAKYIPTRDDVQIVINVRRIKRTKKKPEQFKSPDEDDELYVLDDSDVEFSDHQSNDHSDIMSDL